MKKLYKKIFYILSIFILLCIFSKFINEYFQPFLITIFLLILTRPIYKFLNNLGIFKNQIKAIISLLFINIIFFIVIFKISNLAIKNINTILNGFYYIIGLYRKLCNELLKKFRSSAIIFNSLETHNSNLISSKILKEGAENTTNFLFSYFIANIMTYFILVDSYKIKNFLFKFFDSKVLMMIYKKIKNLNDIFIIEFKLMIICTFITIIGFYFLKINNFVSLGILCGILDILPYIGTIFVFLPLILYKIIIKDYFRSIGLICLYFLLLILRQILETKYVSKNFEIHPLAVLISVYIFVKLTGVIGVFLGPIYIITAKEILEW